MDDNWEKNYFINVEINSDATNELALKRNRSNKEVFSLRSGSFGDFKSEFIGAFKRKKLILMVGWEAVSLA